jgi:hypothetical protein
MVSSSQSRSASFFSNGGLVSADSIDRQGAGVFDGADDRGG